MDDEPTTTLQIPIGEFESEEQRAQFVRALGLFTKWWQAIPNAPAPDVQIQADMYLFGSGLDASFRTRLYEVALRALQDLEARTSHDPGHA